MSYDVLDASTESGEPVYKFLFSIGTDEYRYTSAAFFISDSNETWEPVALRASDVVQTDDMSRNSIRITLPRTNSLAQRFLGKVPEQITSVTIFRTMYGLAEDATDDEAYWKGRVVSASAAGETVELECENIFSSMSRSGLRAKYQRSCRHALYSSRCGVNDYEYATVANILLVDGLNITVDLDSNADSEYYVGGMVETAEGYLRYISAQSGSVLTLMYGLPGDTLATADSNGIPVTLYPGCQHNTTDCVEKFGNLNNYGGFPYIPTKNPFGNSVTGSIA